MATKYINTKYTLLDRAKETSDGKTVLPIISVMNELVDDFFMDVPFVEANMGLKHKIVRDTGMVASTKRFFYKGVKSSKRNKQVVYEDVMLQERRREIDEDEIDTLANPSTKLRQEDEGHARQLGEDVVNAFINGDQDDGSENINGLLQRLSALNPTGLNNVQSNGYTAGVGTSVLIVEWNTDESGGAYGIYPQSGFGRNAPFGVSIRDKGKEPVLDEDDSTATYYAYVAQLKAWAGLCVGNNRKIARLSNINPTIGASKSFTDNGTQNLIKLLNNGRFDRNRTRIYVNPTIKTQMEIYGLDKTNVMWSPMEVFGREVASFQSQIPIRVIDDTILTDSQAVVS
ncbi:hypothetical protein KAR91_57375 [Candidatus Pacearchaeota archaeon]|nr:hypothetical protein [Candidatus Pacearchaeota archaeon]